jgi:nucleoside-diphosphate-sugar epimerase
MITVLGASGFVGSHIVKKLQQSQTEYYAPARDENLLDKELGDVIYCIGLTADFRKRPYDTVEAHVCKLREVLKECKFNSLTYLSSTRLYIHNKDLEIVDEQTPIPVDVTNPFDLFNASKLTGELLTLNCGRENVRVARLSNVYGFDFNSENFITSIIKDAVVQNKVTLRTTPDSAKDYISINDVVHLLIKISLHGKNSIYNVASGNNISNNDVLNVLKQETGCVIEFSPSAEKISFPCINIGKIKSEFGFNLSHTLLDDLKEIILRYKISIAKI